MNIIHLTGSIGPTSGGLGPIVIEFTKEQKLLGNNPIIWSLDSPFVAKEAAKTNGLNLQDIKISNALGPRHIGYSPFMEKKSLKEGSRFDVLHQHSIWLALSRVTNRWRNAFHRPTVVAPQGTLEEYTLGISKWKKKLALCAYEMDNLQHADCLHATAISEAKSFRNFGLTNPIAVIPNGVPVEWLNGKGDPVRFRNRFSIPSDKRILLFLSRVHPKKGLPLLFSAIAELRQAMDGWCLVIAGFEDVPGYQRELEQLAKRLDISKKIIFVGPHFGQDKADVFSAADIFVLPTYSENFGIAVTEALALGLPVLTTYGAPWEELRSHKCGWWVEISVQGVYNALQDAISRSNQELMEMGARGKLLVESKYTWPQVTKMTIELYGWLLRRGSKPDFVVMD